MGLEEFIKKNREQFDDQQAANDVWVKIDKALDSERKPVLVELKWVYRVAASVALILTAGILVGYYMGSQSKADEFAQQRADIERYYEKKVDNKMMQLASYEVDPMIHADLENLEAVYTGLLSESEVDQERYVYALIENFEARLALLEKVLLRMKIHSEKGKKDNKDVYEIQI
jgi:hypothetical protein